MKMTIDLPDDLVFEIKIEAARQKKKLKELVPELLRAGLSTLSTAAAPQGQAMAKWLDEWVALGEAATRGLPMQPTATEILSQDRGSRLLQR
jgi:plasmid stability protein